MYEELFKKAISTIEKLQNELDDALECLDVVGNQFDRGYFCQ